MHTMKYVMFVALAALTVAANTAVAQESAGGADVNSQPAFGWPPAVRQAAPVNAHPQAGSSDSHRARPTDPDQVLMGGDGGA
jgi:hypothetical protein